MPGKPTREEKQRRIEETYKLLARHIPKHAIKRLLRAKYNVGYRTCENYLARARAMMIKHSGRSKSLHKAQALALYESIIQDPESTRRERLEAQSLIDRLLCLPEPQMQRHKMEMGGEVKVKSDCLAAGNVVTELIAKYAAMYDQMLGLASNEAGVSECSGGDGPDEPLDTAQAAP